MTDFERPAGIDVLLVEDNPGDVRLTKEALGEAKVRVTLHVVGDGVGAMTFLRRDGDYADAPRPDVVLLDLNLPQKDGRDVLQEVKRDSDLRRIPVVVLTTSDAEQDILNSYELGANCYIAKPVDMQGFMDAVKAVVHFWFTVVTLPPS